MDLSYDLKKLCDKYIVGGNTFILHHENMKIFGLIHIWNRQSFVLEKLHKLYMITSLKESNRKKIYQSLKDQQLIARTYEGLTVVILR
jgi:hypothetical protein